VTRGTGVRRVADRIMSDLSTIRPTRPALTAEASEQQLSSSPNCSDDRPDRFRIFSSARSVLLMPGPWKHRRGELPT
jgi:hypothetical protein